ncbi:hypothetical protein L596_017678 [Steinernema carpocapsae]|uniref:Uncharacterized protein n=1 Tax=Steinernema carpocapsae TaxID=34508 RepID=A0A4U5N2C8_STECR|nr:hypothetical protein L596_017678 [Steinernema carpocapsae]
MGADRFGDFSTYQNMAILSDRFQVRNCVTVLPVQVQTVRVCFYFGHNNTLPQDSLTIAQKQGSSRPPRDSKKRNFSARSKSVFPDIQQPSTSTSTTSRTKKSKTMSALNVKGMVTRSRAAKLGLKLLE